MKAAFVKQPGPAESILYDDIAVPEPDDGQVLVKVGAVAVNPIDTYVRAGMVAMELPLPFVVGCDVAGTVERVGPEVSRFVVGDRVWGSNQGVLGRQGTFAEYAAIDEQWLYATPDDVIDEDAAAGALVGITAHLGLFDTVKLQAGETLLIIGGTGGVGSMVVQMARAVGARVIATCGTDQKVAACEQLGADLVINYNSEDVVARVKSFAPEGVDVFWETRREPDFDVAIDLLARRGRMIVMAGRDARPPFPVGPFYVKGCSLHGFVMFMATADEQRACSDNINRWLAGGSIKPKIDRVMPLSDTALAHQLQEENTIEAKGNLAGKIVLKP